MSFNMLITKFLVVRPLCVFSKTTWKDTDQAMPPLLAQVFPFTSAATALIGRTFNIRQLQQAKLTEGKTVSQEEWIPVLIDLVSIAAICALAAEAGIEGGVAKGALVGTIAATVAYVLPKLYLRSLLDRHCGTCTSWGRAGLGITVILGLFIALVIFNKLIFS